MRHVLRPFILFPVFLLSILILLVSTQYFPIYAAETSQISVLPKNEIVQGDYFGVGESVTVSGTVNGDVYAAGGNIMVDGTVNGDLLAAGGTVTIIGTVRDNVRVAGGAVSILGTVGRDVTVG